MKRLSFFLIITTLMACSAQVKQGSPEYAEDGRRLLKVPSGYPTIANAVKNSADGDWIIISPGTYFEKMIEVNKSVTISSEWKLSGDRSKIAETVIDSEDKTLFIITADGVEVSGLKIINGDHSLDISSNVTIMHNHFVNNLDAMSFEGSSGGYAGYNTVENDRDDGLDIDLRYGGEHRGSNILVEHNTIINSNDDGIEIRLYRYADQNLHYIIRENTITGSKNAGIQIISYDIFTGKTFRIHHNVISNCKTGLGCMEGSRTEEDLSGATKMDEKVWFYNNTLVDNQMGATGGNSIIAINNVISGNKLGGFKKFGPHSAVVNNLFYMNGAEDFMEINESVFKEGNIFSADPHLTKATYMPEENSPCIDAGISFFEYKDGSVLEIPAKYIEGAGPDIGAIEFGTKSRNLSSEQHLIVEIGEDRVLYSPDNQLLLSADILSGVPVNGYWKLVSGPDKVNILNPDKPETRIELGTTGIYKFSFIASDANSYAEDNVTIRYVTGGNGKEVFLEGKENQTVNVQDYAFSYGKVSVVNSGDPSGNPGILLESEKDGTRSVLEYSIGVSEEVRHYLWLHLKNQGNRKSSVQVRFNRQDPVSLSVTNSKKGEWFKVPGPLTMAGGKWPLFIQAEGGYVLIDNVLFTTNSKFVPGRE